MQIEIEDPELMMFIAVMIINFDMDEANGYTLTGKEKLDRYFPDHEEVMTPSLHGKRYDIYMQLIRELAKHDKEIEKRWCRVPSKLFGYRLTYDKDGMHFGCERINIKTIEQMIEECEHAN